MEKDFNFITRLHSGNLFIVPWPVIESTEFYQSFTSLAKKLQELPVTYTQGVTFLSTMKALMAKLKASRSILS